MKSIALIQALVQEMDKTIEELTPDPTKRMPVEIARWQVAVLREVLRRPDDVYEYYERVQKLLAETKIPVEQAIRTIERDILRWVVEDNGAKLQA